MLSSRGTFGGTLERLDVRGDTETPDFTVAAGRHPVPLKAKYHAIVDGTNGDTILERVDASFLETSLTASGGIIDAPGPEGRTVRLDVNMDSARLEDVLRLAVKAERPPMTGALKLKTSFVLPPGKIDVVKKLKLDGRFSIARAMFTNPDVQTKIAELSARSRGKQAEQGRRSRSRRTSRARSDSAAACSRSRRSRSTYQGPWSACRGPTGSSRSNSTSAGR